MVTPADTTLDIIVTHGYPIGYWYASMSDTNPQSKTLGFYIQRVGEILETVVHNEMFK